MHSVMVMADTEANLQMQLVLKGKVHLAPTCTNEYQEFANMFMFVNDEVCSSAVHKKLRKDGRAYCCQIGQKNFGY